MSRPTSTEAGSRLRERLYNSFWSAGLRIRSALKRISVLTTILGPLARAWNSVGPLLTRPPGNEVEVRIGSRLSLTVPPAWSSFRYLANGVYETEVTDLVRKIVGERMTVVDLGANIGYYSVIASKLVGASGRVFAFEAHPFVFGYLQRNLDSNDCQNVVAVQKAVTDSVASSHLIFNGLEGGFLKEAAPSQDHVVVETTSLDAFFAQRGWPPVDFIKIDIEGSEAAALKGMRELSKRNPALTVVMELNPVANRRSGVSARSLTNIVRELGFKRAHVIEQGMREISFADPRWDGHLMFNFLLVK